MLLMVLLPIGEQSWIKWLMLVIIQLNFFHSSLFLDLYFFSFFFVLLEKDIGEKLGCNMLPCFNQVCYNNFSVQIQC